MCGPLRLFPSGGPHRARHPGAQSAATELRHEVQGMFRLNSSLLFALPLLAISSFASPASAIDYTESVNGELSSNRMAPTLWGALQTGSNFLNGTTDLSDLDYFTINIPSGHNFTGLKLVSYDSGSSGDETAFIGIQAGTVMTVPPTAQTA